MTLRLLVIAVFLTFISINAYTEALVGVVTKISGKTEYQTKDGWQALRMGQKIGQGDTLSTGFRSEIEISVGNTVITIKAMSRLSFQELLDSEGLTKTSLFLRVGKVQAEVNSTKGKGNDFKISSPVSTASVRGTGFEFDGEDLTVSHGNVVLSDSRGNSVSVAPGESASASSNPLAPIRDYQVALTQSATTDANPSDDFGNANATPFIVAPTVSGAPDEAANSGSSGLGATVVINVGGIQ